MTRRHTPKVSEIMSRLPEEVDRRDRALRAQEIFRQASIRHLPVLDGSKLYGVISQRDLQRKGVEDDTELGELCARDVLTVSPVDSIVVAARGMLRRRVNSAIVIDAGMVVGIVTTADILAFTIEHFS